MLKTPNQVKICSKSKHHNHFFKVEDKKDQAIKANGNLQQAEQKKNIHKSYQLSHHYHRQIAVDDC